MVEPPPGFETVFKTRHRKDCLESRLVLEAVGILAEAVHRDGVWCLVVKAEDLPIATAELDVYRRENVDRSTERAVEVPLYRGGGVGVVVYAGVILLIAMLTAQSALNVDWLAVGRMQAGEVKAGQWWRTATALTLHLDAEHLASNLLFGAVFGLLAGRILGGGVAWLAIVVAGALGNYINALVQPPIHSSIGASTGVFAALGLLVAHALRPRNSTPEKPLKRWSPLIGGVILLGFIGVGGERTDVAAHLTGFLAGLLIGWAGCRLPSRWLANPRTQAMAGVVAVTILVAAWVVGIAVVGDAS